MLKHSFNSILCTQEHLKVKSDYLARTVKLNGNVLMAGCLIKPEQGEFAVPAWVDKTPGTFNKLFTAPLAFF